MSADRKPAADKAVVASSSRVPHGPKTAVAVATSGAACTGKLGADDALCHELEADVESGHQRQRQEDGARHRPRRVRDFAAGVQGALDAHECEKEERRGPADRRHRRHARPVQVRRVHGEQAHGHEQARAARS